MDPITIGFDRLQIIIEGFKKRFVDRMMWLGPGSVAVTLAITLIVSDFKDKFGFKANDWRDLTVCAFVIFWIWSAFCFLRAASWQATESLMDDIAQASLAPTQNFALTVFKARGREGSNLLLVYFDVIWDCYLCPFVGQQPGNSDPGNVTEPASDRFNVPKFALLGEQIDGQEVRTHKVSESSRKLTHYHFTFFRMKVATDYEDIFRKPEFTIQERRYKWMTVEELFADPKTVEKNGDVFRVIRDNRQIFFNDKQPPSIDRPVAR